ncbi:MAG: STAS domain-containing protein [Candidatus Obscuribacterales bacterium]
MNVSYDEKTNRTQLHLTGAATFLNMPKLADCLEKIRQDTELHVHLEALDYIDHACLDLLMHLDKQMKLSGGSLVIDWSTLGTVFRDRRKTYREGSVKEFRTATEFNNSDTQTLQSDPSTNQSGSPNNDSEKSQSAQTEVVNTK